MCRLTFEIIDQPRSFAFRVRLQGAIGRTAAGLIPNAIDQLGCGAIGMHHIAENDGNFLEPNRSIPLFSFKRPEKIGSGTIDSPVGVR